MATSHDHVVEMLKAIPGYVEAFEAAYPDAPEPITIEHATDAIALFETTLVTPNSPQGNRLNGCAFRIPS